MKIAYRIAAALAFASFGIAAPALAQTASVQDQNSERFLGLTQLLVDNVDQPDTVILFYIAYREENGDRGFDLGAFYLAPGGKSVRVHGDPLGQIVEQLFGAGVDALAADPEFRSATLVIDHGKPRLTMHRKNDFDAATNFTKRLAAERERVFPGIPLEPYP